jgi:hypothetical protein
VKGRKGELERANVTGVGSRTRATYGLILDDYDRDQRLIVKPFEARKAGKTTPEVLNNDEGSG